ncbi:MAG TPA: hypothetical protein VGG74_04710 [Kofleriaceae bacterium]
MGSGGSQEAPYTLQASIPAGSTHFILDSVITASVDMTFDWIWRHANGSADTVLAEWSQHFDPLGSGDFDAQVLEYDENCAAVDYDSGDQVVFRYTGANTDSTQAFIPNGDGTLSHGRDPNITLPK